MFIMPEYFLRSSNQSIYTDFRGNQTLLGFYNYAKRLRNCAVNLSFDAINFMDANLCALLYAMVYDLKKSNNVFTYVDFSILKRDLNILIRNGFTTYIAKNEFTFSPFDTRDTTVPLKSFAQSDVDSFCSYIEMDFLHQRGLVTISKEHKQKIIDHYLEIFSNVELHANSEDPIFVCGQYFPYQGELKFTLVDLGEGFLKKIAEFTKNSEKINTASKAIDWALRGNSTKKGVCGGKGLIGIKKFCIFSGNTIQVITDNCYYSHFHQSATSQQIPSPMKGTTIHLIFRYLNK
jgi:hypothetical protein